MNINLTSAVIFSVLSAYTPTLLANCPGNVYSINSGRGDVGLLLDIQEDRQLTGVYNGSERALIEYRALFSASAMAYDENTNRMYYVSVNRPESYHVLGADGIVSSDEFNNLDLHASSSKTNQLAYYDFDTSQHVVVANVPETYRMELDPVSGLLFASDRNKIFTIDPNSGIITNVANFDDNMRIGGFTSWGDFIFYGGELLHITNTRTFSIDTVTGASTLKAFHFIDFVTAVTLDQNGQILVAAKNQNQTGNVNSTNLWRLNPATGEKVQAGLFPSRINGLATNTNEMYRCYTSTEFPSEAILSVTGVTGETVTEGQDATFSISFDKETKSIKQLNLALKDGSATAGSDYSQTVTLRFDDGTSTNATLSSTGTTISVPAGVSGLNVVVATTDDSEDESQETLTLDAWFKDDKSDLKSGTVRIDDNDEPELANVCMGNSRVLVGAGGASFLVRCNDGIIQGSSLSGQNQRKVIRWSTSQFGGGSVNEFQANVGRLEIQSLTSTTFSTSISNNSSVCANGGTSGTLIAATVDASIALNSNDVLNCSLRYTVTRCDGRGGIDSPDIFTSNTCVITE